MRQKTALGILKTGRNVYLTGAAGAGKTHALNQYIEYLREKNVGVGITASTGIAATHLGGMTIHAWSGIGIKDFLSDWDIDSLTQRQPLVKRFERTEVLIIDEVSMLRPEILNMVDQVSRAMKRTNLPFGGMQIVLSGDFFQLPPVVRGGEDDAFVDTSSAWQEGDFRICYLTEQYRQKGGELLEILNDIRDGEVSERSYEALQSRMEENLDDTTDAVVLHTHNQKADTRNIQELKKLEGKSVAFEMVSAGRANFVETLKKSVLAPEELELKVGAHVMFVKNNPDQDYVNGTLGEVISLDDEYPRIRTSGGKEITAYPVSWEMVDDSKVLASVTQVPLRLAWAITIHKSQGMSLDSVEADLSQAFTPGQGYVALSRARTLEGLKLHGFNAMALQVHPYVRDRDEQLQRESEHWERIYNQFSPAKVQELHTTFIDRVGGFAPVASDRIPTHLETRSLLMKGKSIAEIAKERSVTVTTIITHLEKLQAAGEHEVLKRLQPESSICKEIAAAFKKTKDTKLSPVHKVLKGKYTFEDIRLARLFIDQR